MTTKPSFTKLLIDLRKIKGGKGTLSVIHRSHHQIRHFLLGGKDPRGSRFLFPFFFFASFIPSIREGWDSHEIGEKTKIAD